MQARFKYQVSYKKALWVKQMVMQPLYGDWDASYNELQGWMLGWSWCGIFSAILYRLATLMPRMGLRQVKQIKAGYVHVKAVQKAMAVNAQKAETMNVELYSHDFETFRVQEYVSHRSSLPPRFVCERQPKRRTIHRRCLHAATDIRYLGKRVSRIAGYLKLGSTTGCFRDTARPQSP
ncbi:hypothetical protein GOBAR_DD06046 [Gossypium barbadense]|nr:hypothetical protein GOBAR_DD06046 [Gossypium barbadense]